jgi:hypothetical protein
VVHERYLLRRFIGGIEVFLYQGQTVYSNKSNWGRNARLFENKVQTVNEALVSAL